MAIPGSSRQPRTEYRRQSTESSCTLAPSLCSWVRAWPDHGEWRATLFARRCASGKTIVTLSYLIRKVDSMEKENIAEMWCIDGTETNWRYSAATASRKTLWNGAFCVEAWTIANRHLPSLLLNIVASRMISWCSGYRKRCAWLPGDMPFRDKITYSRLGIYYLGRSRSSPDDQENVKHDSIRAITKGMKIEK